MCDFYNQNTYLGMVTYTWTRGCKKFFFFWNNFHIHYIMHNIHTHIVILCTCTCIYMRVCAVFDWHHSSNRYVTSHVTRSHTVVLQSITAVNKKHHSAVQAGHGMQSITVTCDVKTHHRVNLHYVLREAPVTIVLNKCCDSLSTRYTPSYRLQQHLCS